MRLQVEYVEPDSLTPAPYNPRKISRAALKRLAGLLDAHGFVDPVIVRREDRLVIGGHQRLAANRLREKPDATVPCVFLDGLSDAEAKALNVALNNPKAQGQYDLPKLGELLVELDRLELDVPELTGFERVEIDELAAGRDESRRTQPTVPECFQVVVECDSEDQQRRLYERFRKEGLRCRLLVL